MSYQIAIKRHKMIYETLLVEIDLKEHVARM